MSTLQKIAAHKVINIGYRDAAPYSYKTSDGHVVGYVIDLCKDVTESLKKELHINNLVVNYVHVPLTMRTTMLNHDIIDMDCSFNTDTEKREGIALFSRHYLSVHTRFGMLAGNKIRSSTDLAGRTISITKGSTDLINLNRLNRLQKLSLLFLSLPSMKESFDAMSHRKSFATVMNEVSLKVFIENSLNPKQYMVSSEVLGSPLDLGIMMSHDDTQLKMIVDKALTARFKRADFKQFYDLWFNSNLPDKGINLHLPLTPDMHKYLTQ